MPFPFSLHLPRVSARMCRAGSCGPQLHHSRGLQSLQLPPLSSLPPLPAQSSVPPLPSQRACALRHPGETRSYRATSSVSRRAAHGRSDASLRSSQLQCAAPTVARAARLATPWVDIDIYPSSRQHSRRRRSASSCSHLTTASTATPRSQDFEAIGKNGTMSPVRISDIPEVVGQKAIKTWTRGQCIGKGSYGTVYKAFDPETLSFFAVKEMLLDDGSQRHRDQLDDELGLLRTLEHPHIIRYLGHECTDQHVLIQLEYAAGGSVAALLAEFGPLASEALREASAGILAGLEYLHTLPTPVVHRDVKGANVLISEGFVVKLTDFGCSKQDLHTQSFSTVGSIPWMAPEVINQNAGHGRKADIWSYGCTIIEMVSAQKPWGDYAFNNFMYALHHIGSSGSSPPVPAFAPELCQELVSSCTKVLQCERPSSTDLLEHPFLRPPTRPRRRAATY